VIEENAKAEASGRASFAIDGKMIDVPVVERARRQLARLARIEAREVKKRQVSV
jgi:citrate lyase subunit beta/citryl-CoA lyase